MLTNFNDMIDKKGRTLLHHACYRNCFKDVRYLIDNNADLNKKDIYGKKPLCTAIYRNNKEICKILIKEGQSIDEVDEDGRSRIHRFSCKGSKKVVELILDLGADINIRDFMSKTPIFHAVYSNNYDNFRLLISKGCIYNIYDFFGRNILINNIFGIKDYINTEDLRIFSWCLENLDNKFHKDCNGCNAMFYAILVNNLHMVSKLFFSGLKFEKITSFCEDPFIICKSIEMAKFLLILGADTKKFVRMNNYNLTKNNSLCDYIENWEQKHKPDIIKQVNIIRNWWINIYYSPYHPIGKRRLFKSYCELFK